jgi:hypothetical protein
MNAVRVVSLMGLIFLAMPAHGMWKSIKDAIVPEHGLTIQTQQIIAAAVAIGIVEAAESALSSPFYFRLYHWSDVIARNSHPLLLRTALIINAIAMPSAFLVALRQYPEFWNKQEVNNRIFLGWCTLMSLAAIRIGITAINATE